MDMDDIDCRIVVVDCEKYAWPQINEKAIEASPGEKKIANYILSLVTERDVIQPGTGFGPVNGPPLRACFSNKITVRSIKH